MYAIAFDIGTTTLAASLVLVGSGERLALCGAPNPQREFGADVVARLASACASPETLSRLALLVNGELRRLAQVLSGSLPAGAAVGSVAFAGNPAMEHLLLGLPVDSIARLPYRPLFTQGRHFAVTDLGWEGAVEAYLFPLPGGFVGGDLVAFLYGEDAGEGDAVRLFLDLGTNAEIALQSGDTLLVTSAAAGPAFEGGNLSCGMPAVAGAISDVAFSGDRVEVTTIGGAPAAGICGSAAIGALAGLRKAGVVDATGRLLPPAEIPTNLAVRVREVAGTLSFVLYQDARQMVCLTQEDIRQIQLAKGAIRAGIEVLAERAGIRTADVAEVIVTGSFGAELRPEHLGELGILPAETVRRVRFVREGALAGVERALGRPEGPAAVERLSSRCRVVPLSGNPAFERLFLERLDFPQVS